jgi:hypothetical protein
MSRDKERISRREENGKKRRKKKVGKDKISRDLPSFGAGGLRVAQLVRMALVPSHCPFIPAMAFSAS